jgi:hypothetical protein
VATQANPFRPLLTCPYFSMMKAVKIKLYFVNAIHSTNCRYYLLPHYCKRRYCVIVGYDVSRRSQGVMSSLPFATASALHLLCKYKQHPHYPNWYYSFRQLHLSCFKRHELDIIKFIWVSKIIPRDFGINSYFPIYAS